MQAFVAGSTGAVGRKLVELAGRHHLSVVPHARPKSAASLEHSNKKVLELSDPSLPTAMAGCTTIIQLVGTMRSRFATGDTYESSDIGTTRQLVAAAKAAGVRHFVLLSSVGAGRPVGAYLKAKAEAERLVRESGLPFTFFRPSAFEDREGQSMPMLRSITSALGLTAYRPISLAELASAILHVARQGAPLAVALEGTSLWAVVDEAASLR